MSSHPSLRRQLLIWLLIPLSLLVALDIWLSYRSATAMATKVYDKTLLGSARIIAEQVHYDQGTFQVVIPPAALELFQSDSDDRVYYSIIGPSGHLLAGSIDLPDYRHALGHNEFRFFDLIFRDDEIRVVALSQPIFSSPDKDPVIIEVAQTRHAYQAFIHELWTNTIHQQLLILLLTAVLVWFGLRWGLAPITRLKQIVQRRQPYTLEPLDTNNVPQELVPVVEAMNDYIARLDEHIAAQHRFIAHASHQLRTPLTVLNTQVNYALRSQDIESKDTALHGIHDGVKHATRLVNQLLNLSKAEMADQIAPTHHIDLVTLIKNVLENFALQAQTKNIDLGMECHVATAIVNDPLSMLYEMLANLVDNAIRFAPEQGIITITLSCNTHYAILQVTDNGPGIPSIEYEHIFERFYQVRGRQSDGYGLGLAIVKEIVTAAQGSVILSSPNNHSGLIVTVKLPLITTLSPQFESSIEDNNIPA